MSTVQDNLKAFLKQVVQIGDVEGAALITRDGFEIETQLPPSINSETFCALSATMMGAAQTASVELNTGQPHMVIVETDRSNILCFGAGHSALLVITVKAHANLGLVLVKTREFLKKIEDELGK